MITFQHTEVVGWEAAIRGMRNPLESWEKSDSGYCLDSLACHSCEENRNDCKEHIDGHDYILGPNDHDLMMRLVKAGDEHAKFMRMIHVSMDILAPLYWWKQADTYKIGFVTNSCSTMHMIHKKAFTPDDFSHEHLINYEDSLGIWKENHDLDPRIEDEDPAKYPEEAIEMWSFAPMDILILTIKALNHYRDLYLKTKDKKYWWQMIQLLPDSYNQLRTCDTNYATLRKMYHQRKGHKLDEWNDFCAWIKTLPYSELITG